MECVRKVAVLTFLLIFTSQTEARSTKDQEQEPKEKQDELVALTKEKNDLFLQLTAAIDDTIKSFKNSNDTGLRNGFQYLVDLKNRLKDLNDSDSDVTDVVDARRKLNKYTMISDLRKAKDNLNDKEFVDQLFKKKDKSKKDRKKYLEREKMEKRVADWMKAREAEKAKIRQYREQEKQRDMIGQEKTCPRYGLKKKKGKSKKFKGIYPCCRKCCKSSYMGCL